MTHTGDIVIRSQAAKTLTSLTINATGSITGEFGALVNVGVLSLNAGSIGARSDIRVSHQSSNPLALGAVSGKNVRSRRHQVVRWFRQKVSSA